MKSSKTNTFKKNCLWVRGNTTIVKRNKTIFYTCLLNILGGVKFTEKKLNMLRSCNLLFGRECNQKENKKKTWQFSFLPILITWSVRCQSYYIIDINCAFFSFFLAETRKESVWNLAFKSDRHEWWRTSESVSVRGEEEALWSVQSEFLTITASHVSVEWMEKGFSEWRVWVISSCIEKINMKLRSSLLSNMNPVFHFLLA